MLVMCSISVAKNTREVLQKYITSICCLGCEVTLCLGYQQRHTYFPNYYKSVQYLLNMFFQLMLGEYPQVLS